MKDLIERLEKATGPDGALDIAIYRATEGLRVADGTVMEYGFDRDGAPMWRCKHRDRDFGSWWHMQEYTGSIDAALTLVPDIHVGHVDFSNPMVGRCHAKVWPMPSDYCDANSVMEGSGITPAIALCVAALKARDFVERDLTKMEASNG